MNRQCPHTKGTLNYGSKIKFCVSQHEVKTTRETAFWDTNVKSGGPPRGDGTTQLVERLPPPTGTST